MSFDSAEENRAFAEKFNFQYPLLCDTDRQMGLAYGAATTPDEGFAARIGVIINPQGEIILWEPKVSPKDFATRALALLP